MAETRWQRKLYWTCCIIVGLVFVIAAGTKFSFATRLTREMMEVFRLDYQNAGDGVHLIFALLARLLIALELWLGLALFQPYWRRRIVLPTTALLLIVFSLYLGKLAFIDRLSENCGCFGDVFPLAPLPSLIKNFVLLGLIAVAWKLAPRSSAKRLWLPAGLAGLALACTFLAMPLRSRPNDFAKLSDFTGAAPGQLHQGSRILAFLSLECDHCREVATELAARQFLHDAVFVVYLGERETVSSFAAETGLQHPWMISDDPDADFFPYIGDAPPRVYLIHNGRIRQHWDFDVFDADAVHDAWAESR